MRKEVRNARIVRLRESGLTLREIGARFGLTRARVHEIVRRQQIAESQRLLRIGLRRQVEAKGMDHHWDWRTLGEALGVRFRKSFVQHCELRGRATTSLREVFDMVVAEKPASPGVSYRFPLYSMVGIGRKTYFRVVSALSALKLGKEARREWAWRRKAIQGHFSVPN